MNHKYKITDAISRQAAKEAYCKHFCHRGVACPDTLCKEVNEAFDELPSAQPERKMGHWIRVAGMNERCSACNKYFPLSYFTGRPFDINYCPNCGADMRGEKDEHID